MRPLITTCLTFFAVAALLASSAGALTITVDDVLVFYDDFESAPGVSSTNYQDTSGDYDPDNGSNPGYWDVNESAGGSPGTEYAVQVTDSTTSPDPGPFQGSNYGRFARDSGFSTPLSLAFFDGNATTGQKVVVDLMYALNPDYSNSNPAFMLYDSVSDTIVTQTRFSVGAGDIGNIQTHNGSGFVQTGLDFNKTTGWNHYRLQYTVGDSTASLTINGETNATIGVRNSSATFIDSLRIQGQVDSNLYLDTPEPASCALLGVGVAALISFRRRLKRERNVRGL